MAAVSPAPLKPGYEQLEPPSCGKQLASGIDGAVVRAMIPFTTLVPLLFVIVLSPAGGVVSDSLAASTPAQLASCCIGYAISGILEALALGRAYGLVSLPAYAATIITTFQQPTLAEAGKECNAWCTAHLLAVGILMSTSVVGMVHRGVTVSATTFFAAIMGFVLICYLVVVNQDDFDATDPQTRRYLAAVGAAEVSLVVFERSIAASMPARGMGPERINFM